MNTWTAKSIALANAPGYLDKLSAIYVMNVNPERPPSAENREAIKTAFADKDTPTLIRLLIDNEVFPIKDSYVGFLRKKPKAIDENPATIKRIGERLYSMGIRALLREAARPKETNRQLGQSFKKSLTLLGYPILSADKFADTQETAILKGGDSKLAKYAREHLGSNLTKGIDLLLRKGNQYVLGEAKFLTTPGGEQDRGFDDASNFINEAHEQNVKRIALLDGYVWLESESGLHQKIVESNLEIFSALLLPDYIKTL